MGTYQNRLAHELESRGVHRPLPGAWGYAPVIVSLPAQNAGGRGNLKGHARSAAPG